MRARAPEQQQRQGVNGIRRHVRHQRAALARRDQQSGVARQAECRTEKQPRRGCGGEQTEGSCRKGTAQLPWVCLTKRRKKSAASRRKLVGIQAVKKKEREPHCHGQSVAAANVPVPNFPKRLPTLGAAEWTCPVMNRPHMLPAYVSPPTPIPQQPPWSPQPPPHMQQGVGETQTTEASTSMSVSVLDSAAVRHTSRPLTRESRAMAGGLERPPAAAARRCVGPPPVQSMGTRCPASRPSHPAHGRWTGMPAGRRRQAAPSRPPRLAMCPPLPAPPAAAVQ